MHFGQKKSKSHGIVSLQAWVVCFLNETYKEAACLRHVDRKRLGEYTCGSTVRKLNPRTIFTKQWKKRHEFNRIQKSSCSHGSSTDITDMCGWTHTCKTRSKFVLRHGVHSDMNSTILWHNICPVDPAAFQSACPNEKIPPPFFFLP